MGHIHAQNNQIQEAVQAWVTVYVIAKQMNLAQALQALSMLAPQLGLPEGLEGWETLADRIQNEEGKSQNENDGESEEEQISQFVAGVVKAVREKSKEAPKLFDAVSKMAVDPQAPPHYQELGNALKQYMSGVRNPDLSKLPKELALIVLEKFGEGEDIS